MPELNLLPVLVAAIAAFAVGFAYYAALGDRLAQSSETTASAEQPPWTIAVEFARGLILAAVTAGVAVKAEIDEWTGGLLLGLVLWVGFPFVLLTGAVVHEKTPWQLAAIHAGDWLAKLLVVAVIVSVWQ